MTYEIGIQRGGLVITSLQIRPASASAHPSGGLTAARARSLIRPAAARAELAKAPAKRRWRVEFAEDFVRDLRRQIATPAIPRPRATLTREQRLALVAGAYVAARRSGAPNPRKVAAKVLRRPDASIRDDLHAARHASPPLLTAAGPGSHAGGGGELTAAAKKTLERLRAGTAASSFTWSAAARARVTKTKIKARAARPTRKGPRP